MGPEVSMKPENWRSGLVVLELICTKFRLPAAHVAGCGIMGASERILPIFIDQGAPDFPRGAYSCSA